MTWNINCLFIAFVWYPTVQFVCQQQGSSQAHCKNKQKQQQQQYPNKQKTKTSLLHQVRDQI